MKSIIFAAVLVISASLLAFAEEKEKWTLLPPIENFNKEDQAYYESTSIVQKADIFQVMTKLIPGEKVRAAIITLSKKAVPPRNYDKFKYSIQLNEVNCKEKRHRLLSFIDFDTDDVAINSGEKASDWSDIPIMSLNEQLYKLVCSAKESIPRWRR
jgi:hypothetical protein